MSTSCYHSQFLLFLPLFQFQSRTHWTAEPKEYLKYNFITNTHKNTAFCNENLFNKPTDATWLLHPCRGAQQTDDLSRSQSARQHLLLGCSWHWFLWQLAQNWCEWQVVIADRKDASPTGSYYQLSGLHHSFFFPVLSLLLSSLCFGHSACFSSPHWFSSGDNIRRVASGHRSHSVTMRTLLFLLTFLRIALTPVSQSPTGFRRKNPEGVEIKRVCLL